MYILHTYTHTYIYILDHISICGDATLDTAFLNMGSTRNPFTIVTTYLPKSTQKTEGTCTNCLPILDDQHSTLLDFL